MTDQEKEDVIRGMAEQLADLEHLVGTLEERIRALESSTVVAESDIPEVRTLMLAVHPDTDNPTSLMNYRTGEAGSNVYLPLNFTPSGQICDVQMLDGVYEGEETRAFVISLKTKEVKDGIRRPVIWRLRLPAGAIAPDAEHIPLSKRPTSTAFSSILRALLTLSDEQLKSVVAISAQQGTKKVKVVLPSLLDSSGRPVIPQDEWIKSLSKEDVPALRKAAYDFVEKMQGLLGKTEVATQAEPPKRREVIDPDLQQTLPGTNPLFDQKSGGALDLFKSLLGKVASPADLLQLERWLNACHEINDVPAMGNWASTALREKGCEIGAIYGRAQALERILLLARELGWNNTDASQWLKENYGKNTRQELTDIEASHAWIQLSALKSANS